MALNLGNCPARKCGRVHPHCSKAVPSSSCGHTLQSVNTGLGSSIGGAGVASADVSCDLLSPAIDWERAAEDTRQSAVTAISGTNVSKEGESPMSQKNRNAQGFSLIEALIVISVILILSGITIFKSFGTMESYQANSAMNVVTGQLRVARELAITQRRAVLVTFNLGAVPQS